MKRIIAGLFFVAVFAGLANAQAKQITGTMVAVETGRYKSTNQGAVSRGAEKPRAGEWETFWQAFSSAAQKRDRRALKAMMSTSFQFASEEMGPDQAFTFLDAQKGKAWIALNRVTAKGVVPYKSPSSPRPSRIAPPSAGKKADYDGWRAIFELGSDGRWRWVAFVIGD